SELVARIVADAVDLARIERAILEEAAQTVRELDLSSTIARGRFQSLVDIRGENVPSDDGEVRRCLAARRLLDEVANLMDAATEIGGVVDGDHAVVRDVFHGDAL